MKCEVFSNIFLSLTGFKFSSLIFLNVWIFSTFIAFFSFSFQTTTSIQRHVLCHSWWILNAVFLTLKVVELLLTASHLHIPIWKSITSQNQKHTCKNVPLKIIYLLTYPSSLSVRKIINGLLTTLINRKQHVWIFFKIAAVSDRRVLMIHLESLPTNSKSSKKTKKINLVFSSPFVSSVA